MTKDPVILDAKNKSLGRLASEVASLLRGKMDPNFERHVKPTQKVVVKNAKLVRVTGRKMEQESHEKYSGYPGGFKRVPYATTFAKDPRKLIEIAVAGMIPNNRLKKEILKNLTIYADEN